MLFLLHHRHRPPECAASFAAWKGFPSPLRGVTSLCSCLPGGHELWWEVEAAGERQALAQLPPYVAARTSAIRVARMRTP